MKFKLILALCILILLGNNCSKGDLSPTSPEKLINAFSSFIAAEDNIKAESCFTKESWKSRNNSGERFFKQAKRKKFEMKYIDSKLNETKAAITADIILKGKAVDRIYFYAIFLNGLWKIDGLNENKNQVDHYINGRLPARFNLSSYSGNEELKALGVKLISIAKTLNDEAKEDPEKKKTMLDGVLSGDPVNTYSGLRLLLKVSDLRLKVVSTHMVGSIKRGTIVINDESGKEKVFLYLKKTDKGWELINCTVGWLSEESLLR